MKKSVNDLVWTIEVPQFANSFKLARGSCHPLFLAPICLRKDLPRMTLYSQRSDTVYLLRCLHSRPLVMVRAGLSLRA